jgi:hypothetical protein
MYKKALLLVSSTVIACLLGELLIRSLGYRSYRVYDLEITVRPNSFAVPHQQLGYMIYPGKFDIQFKNGYSWSATHGADSLRITSSQIPLTDPRPQIFVYGCSVAYGYGVADSESFPYLLQDILPGMNVKNYAVPGFAQVHAYLQLKEAIATGNVPRLVVLTYASFHDIRNTLCRQRRKDIYPYNRKSRIDGIAYPVAKYESPNSFSIYYEPIRYREWPLMRYSAALHLAENQFNQSEVKWKKSHEVSKLLIRAIHTLCVEHGIQLVVAGIQNDPSTREMLSSCARTGIDSVDLSFEPNDQSYTLQPFDPHPNARGHAYFAEKLSAYIIQKKSGVVPRQPPSVPNGTT